MLSVDSDILLGMLYLILDVMFLTSDDIFACHRWCYHVSSLLYGAHVAKIIDFVDWNITELCEMHNNLLRFPIIEQYPGWSMQSYDNVFLELVCELSES